MPLRLYPSLRPSRPELLYRGQIHADEQRNGRPQPQHAPSHGQPFDLVVGEVLISYPPRTRLCKRLPGPVNAGEPRRIPKRTFRRPKAEDRSRHFPLRPKTSGAVNAGEPRPSLRKHSAARSARTVCAIFPYAARLRSRKRRNPPADSKANIPQAEGRGPFAPFSLTPQDLRGRKRRRAPALLTQTFRSAKREDRLRGGIGALRWEFTSGLSTCRRPEHQPWQPQWHPQAGCSWARR